MEEYSKLYLMGEEGRKGNETTFAKLSEKLSKSSASIVLELESKLLDKIIKDQSEKIEKMIEDNK